MAERRITRRQLLERISAVGAAAALAPIIAACQAAVTPSPSPSPSAAPASATPGATAASPSPTETAPPTPVPTPEAELFVYNWDAYIGDTTIPDFEKKYNIRVKYDKFDTADTQIATIRKDGKGGGFDVTFPASTEIPGLVRDGIVKPLDPTSSRTPPTWAPSGRTRATTRATRTRCRTCGGPPATPGTRPRSRTT